MHVDISAVNSEQFYSAESEKSGGVLSVDSQTTLRFHWEPATKNPLPQNKVSRSFFSPPHPPMPECKLRYIRATVAVHTCRVPAKGCCRCCCTRSGGGKQWWTLTLVCFFLSQRRAHARPCRPARAPSHVTVHRRVWRLKCACTFTRRHCYFCRKGDFKGSTSRFIVMQNNNRSFQKFHGFFLCHNGRSMPPCEFKIKICVYCVSFAILWRLYLKLDQTERSFFCPSQSRTSLPIRSRVEVKKCNYFTFRCWWFKKKKRFQYIRIDCNVAQILND